MKHIRRAYKINGMMRHQRTAIAGEARYCCWERYHMRKSCRICGEKGCDPSRHPYGAEEHRNYDESCWER